MTRPRKQTVDWFPHSVNHGMTMYVLDKKYGIAGYYFWFRLLELLGDTEGHFIDTENIAKFEYLQAYTHTDKPTCIETLDLLASLDAIDSELWHDSRMIWSDNFVKGLAALYRNRNTTIPVKPDNYRNKPQPEGINVNNKRKKPDKEVEEGKEGKEKDNAPPGPSDTVGAALFFSCPYFDVDLNYRFKLAKEYPALNDDLLRKELSNMEDWISDNSGKKKFKANGHLANPKLFIKNWLNRVGGIVGPGSDKPKGFAAVQKWAEKGEGHG
jgi:hypothetical protein